MSVPVEAKRYTPPDLHTLDEYVKDIQKDPRIKRVHDFVTELTDSTDEKGRPDVEKMIYNATYTIGGEVHAQMSELILNEQVKLANLRDVYRRKRSEVYQAKSNARYGFVPSIEGMKIMVDGDDSVSELMAKIERQELYISHLERMMKSLNFYKNGVDTIVDAAELGKETGKILCL